MPEAPRAFYWTIGQVCKAGQHENCGLVGDPYADDSDSGLPVGSVWACACDCHPDGGPGDAD